MYVCIHASMYVCAYTRSVGGVGRVSHRNITQTPSVIKESNCNMESEKEAERIRETDSKNWGNERKTNRDEDREKEKRYAIYPILYR